MVMLRIVFTTMVILLNATTPISANQNFDYLLDQKPRIFKADGRPKATAGILLYAIKNGKAYVLLGQETKDKTYCEMGGSMELLKNGHSETFLHGAIRECAEETAGVYKLKPSYVRQKKHIYYENKKERQVVIIFVPAPFVSTNADLSKAVSKAKHRKQKEKSDFQWLDASQLAVVKRKNSKTYILRNSEGQDCIIRFRRNFRHMLLTREFKQILHKLN